MVHLQRLCSWMKMKANINAQFIQLQNCHLLLMQPMPMDCDILSVLNLINDINLQSVALLSVNRGSGELVVNCEDVVRGHTIRTSDGVADVEGVLNRFGDPITS